MATKTPIDRASALLGRPTGEPTEHRATRRKAASVGLVYAKRPKPGRHPGGRAVRLTAEDLAPVIAWLDDKRTIADAVEKWAVCRATFYKWIDVIEDAGYRVLSDSPRRPCSYWIAAGPTD